MPDKQLNVWIPEELRDYVARRAEKERRGMNSIIAELIQQDMAQHNDKVVGQNSLIALREIVSAEIRQAHAQLRHDLRDDRQHEAEPFFEFLRKQTDRLAGLIIMRAFRNSNKVNLSEPKEAKSTFFKRIEKWLFFWSLLTLSQHPFL